MLWSQNGDGILFHKIWILLDRSYDVVVLAVFIDFSPKLRVLPFIVVKSSGIPVDWLAGYTPGKQKLTMIPTVSYSR